MSEEEHSDSQLRVLWVISIHTRGDLGISKERIPEEIRMRILKTLYFHILDVIIAQLERQEYVIRRGGAFIATNTGKALITRMQREKPDLFRHSLSPHIPMRA